MIEGLPQTLEALGAGDRANALQALRSAWQRSRAPELADLYTQLGAEASRGLPPLDSPKATRKALHERWVDLAARRRLVDVSRLLASLRAPPWTRVGERVERLARFDDDPRIALALAEFVRELPVLSALKRGQWATLIGLIARIGDPRTRPLLEARLASAPGTVFERACLHPHLTQALAQVPTAPLTPLDDPKARALVAAVGRELRRLEAGPPPDDAAFDRAAPVARSVEALLAAVYAAPASDAPRQVYGDVLQEQGDPVGELIALQLRRGRAPAKGEAAKRERALLKAHLAAALGPLEPVIVPHTARLERGFLAVAAVRFRTKAQHQALAAHPGWSTLVELVPASKDTNAQLVRTAPLASLTRLTADRPEMVDALLDRPTAWPQLTDLTLGWIIDTTRLETLLASERLPALRSLTAWNVAPQFPTRLRRWPLFKQLERLSVGEPPGAGLAAWAKLVVDAPALVELKLGGLRVSRVGGRLRARFEGQLFTTVDAEVLNAFRGLVREAQVHAESAPGLARVKGIAVERSGA